MVPDKTKRREGELDALRGIAAVSVMFFHYSGLFGMDLSFLLNGVTGVDLFFMISGYVIFMTLEKTATAKEFIVSRLSRLYPSYLTVMAITILISYFLGNEAVPSARILGGNITMMQPFFVVPYIDDVYWTLTVEMQFYIFMLIIFLLRKLDKIEWIGMGLVIFIQVYHIISLSFSTSSKFYIFPHSFFPLINHFQLFFAGIIFYRIKSLGFTWRRHFYITVCLVFSVLLYPYCGKSHYYIDTLNFTIMLLVYFCVFYFFVFGKLKFIAVKPLLFLGAISYCLYLIHLKPGQTLHAFISGQYGWHPAVVTFMIILFNIAISTLITFRIERPIIKFLKRNIVKKNPLQLQPII